MAEEPSSAKNKPSAPKAKEGKEKAKKANVKKEAVKPEPKPKPKPKVEIKIKPEPESKPLPKPELKKEELPFEAEEGELAIDVYETDNDIIIQSTIGGIKPEELDISIENDMVTIRGNREHSVEEQKRNYIYKECYWGSFARKVILPEEVDETRAKASMKNGILTLIMPKLHRRKKKKVVVKPEE